MINRHRRRVLNRTVLSICFKKNGDKVPRSLYTRFIFILVNALARCSLGHDHRSTTDLWLDVCSFCSCSCSRALTAANCHYALWRQISHVHVTLLWRECFYGAIWSWILPLLLFTLAITLHENSCKLTTDTSLAKHCFKANKYTLWNCTRGCGWYTWIHIMRISVHVHTHTHTHTHTHDTHLWYWYHEV